MAKRSKKLYTVSSTFFETLDEAKSQILQWYSEDELKAHTKIIEVKKVYDPEIVVQVTEDGE